MPKNLLSHTLPFLPTISAQDLLQSVRSKFIQINSTDLSQSTLQQLKQECQARAMTLSQESAQQHQKVAACFTQFQQLDQRANNLISLIEISNEQQGALDWYIEELRTQQTQLIQLSWKYHEYAKKVAGLLAQYQKNIIELHLSSQKLKTVNPIEVELSHQLCETFRARLDQLDYTYQKLRIPTESPTGFSTDGTNAETAYHEACASMIVTQG